MANPIFHFMGEFRIYFFSNPFLFHFSDSILLIRVKFFYWYQSKSFTGGSKDSLLVAESTFMKKPFSRSTYGLHR